MGAEADPGTPASRPTIWPHSLGLRGVYACSSWNRRFATSWSLDTSVTPTEWSPENPSRGQCDISNLSLVVHDLVGGELLAADVYLGDERIEAHMWNRLASGIEVDLTRAQFGRGEVIGQPRVRPRPAEFTVDHPRYHRYEEAPRLIAPRAELAPRRQPPTPPTPIRTGQIGKQYVAVENAVRSRGGC